METAFGFGGLSYARRKKVGALLVIPEGGRFEGINGMPSGFDNNCEEEYVRVEGAMLDPEAMTPDTIKRLKLAYPEMFSDDPAVGESFLVTKRECLHAEANAIAKVARSTQSTIGATMYTTLSPCLECSKLMIQCGISRVVCAEVYRIPEGIELLKEAGIQVDIMPLSRNHVYDDELTLQDEGRAHDDEDHWRGYSHP